MTVQNQHGDNTDDADKPDQPGGPPPMVDLEVRNTVVAATVSNAVQAHTIGTVEFHAHPAHPAPPMPRQLPGAPRGFVGRLDLLADLDHRPPAGSPDREQGAGMVVISAIGGIGKTWLALTWAHRNLHRFPDGQLAVDLRGFSPGEPRHAADVLADFLAALGVDRDHQPTDLDARVALYRTHTTGKRLLILLDNAAATDQVVPLLPGGDSCTVLITSRNRLHSLIARHSGRPVHLDVLTDNEAHTLLDAALDSTDAKRAITELINLCSGFPLALGLIAARLRTHLDLQDDLVAEVCALGLAALDSDDPAASLPAVLSWSLRRLTDEQRTVFGLLGVAPGPDTTLPAVVSLTALPLTAARMALSTLEEASLVDRRPHGRYAMHDLVRDYAATTALPDGVRETALVRVGDFHLHTAHTADRLFYPHGSLVRPDAPAPGVHPLPLPDAAAATSWLEAEHTTLLATQRAAAALGRHQVVWHLAWTLETFHYRRGHRRDALASWRLALDSAAHLPDPATRSRAHRFLGRACSRLGLNQEAIWHLNRALDLAVHHHDRAQQAHAHQQLAYAWGRRGDDRRALDHARYALDIHHVLDQPVREAGALNQVGWFAARLGDFETARDHCRAALTLQRQHHNIAGQAAALGSLGYIAHHTGDHRQAIDHCHQALTLYRILGNTYQVADTLDRMSHLHTALGQHDRARAVLREALDLYREQGRDNDAQRLLRQFDDLDPSPDRTETAN